MLTPRKTKFRRYHRRRNANAKGVAQKNNSVTFGDIGIIVLDPCELTSRQIEAARIAATRYMKREGQMWIRIFPDKPITKIPLEVRMGKGKGGVEYYAAVVKPGRIMFEMDGIPMEVAQEALRLAAQKLPVRTKFVIRRDLQD